MNASTPPQNPDGQPDPGVEFVGPYMALSLWMPPGTLNGLPLPTIPVCTDESQGYQGESLRTMVMHWGFAAQQGAAFERLVRILTDKWAVKLHYAIKALNLDQEDEPIVKEAKQARNRLAHATVSYDPWSGTFAIEEPEWPPVSDDRHEALRATRYHVENAEMGEGPDTPLVAETIDLADVRAMAVTIRGAMKVIARSEGWHRGPPT